MNLKNVKRVNYSEYMNDLIKSLSNFCNKSPLQATIKVVREMGLIYVYYLDKELEIKINVNQNKKDVISHVKSILENEYPIIYKKSNCVPNADEVRKLLDEGKSLEEALNSTKINYEPLYKIIRCHNRYNEMDVMDLSNKDVFKFKCKIPLMSILEDLKYNGKDAEVLSQMNLLYKIS